MTENLILVPGLLCDARVWRDQVSALEGRVTVSIADITQDDSLTGMAKTVLTNAPDRFAMAGHSLGGRVAMEIWRLAPERVTKLCLMSTGRRAALPGEAERRAEWMAASEKQGVVAIADQMLTPSMHKDKQKDEPLVAEMVAMLERAGLDVLKRQFHAMLHRADMTALLPTITCPTLVAVGREDSYSPLDHHQYIHDHIAGSTLSVIENAGHMAPMEQPEQVTKAMENWLEL